MLFWQLTNPIEAVVFDCDGTLSTIEGIDELAKNRGVYDIVRSMTEEAMAKTGINPVLYEKRLQLVNPSYTQIVNLGKQYFVHRIPDVENIISILMRLNKTIYLMSAGVNPAVEIFGELLTIPKPNIFAVNLSFDKNGHYLDFDRQSPLTQISGKKELVAVLKKEHSSILYIGDGMNDYSAYDLVTRFVGFGGAYYRTNMENSCDFYIRDHSMASLLPLSLTTNEYKKLLPNEINLYEKGIKAIKEEKVKVPKAEIPN